VLSLDWSPCSPNILCSAANDGSLRLWDIRTGIPLACFDMHAFAAHSDGVAHDGPIHSVRFSKCGSFIYSLGADRRLRKWNASTANNTDLHFSVPRVEVSARFCESICVVEDLVLLVPYGINIASFACDSGRLLSLLDPHYGQVTSICANFSKISLFSSDAAGSLRVWQPASCNHYHGPLHLSSSNLKKSVLP
jgi:WD40 repeat protein